MAVKVDDLADAIADALAEYSEEVTDAIKEDVRQVSKECLAEIKSNAPVMKGKYKKSWKIKEAYESKNDIRIIIHSPKEYRLTHLLEHGHAKVSGGRTIGAVDAIPHIGPAEKNAEKKLLKKVQVSISGGNA